MKATTFESQPQHNLIKSLLDEMALDILRSIVIVRPTLLLIPLIHANFFSAHL
jgi:hypothetical protein